MKDIAVELGIMRVSVHETVSAAPCGTGAPGKPTSLPHKSGDATRQEVYHHPHKNSLSFMLKNKILQLSLLKNSKGDTLWHYSWEY